MLGTILAAGFGSLLLSNPPRKRRRRRNPDSKSTWLNTFMDEVQKIAPNTSFNDQGVWVNGHMYHGQGFSPKEAAAETVRQLPRLLKKPKRRNPSDEARELALYIENDSALYRSQAQPIMANLRKKIAKGKYDAIKALKLWQYLADAGAQKYTKEFGGSGNGSYGSFNAAARREAAKELAEGYEDELRSTNPRRRRSKRRRR